MRHPRQGRRAVRAAASGTHRGRQSPSADEIIEARGAGDVLGPPSIGASTVAWYDESLGEALERAASLVPLVEIFSAHNHDLLGSANLRAALACGLRLTVHAPWAGLDLDDPIEERRHATLAVHDRQLERAAAVGAEVYVVHPDGGAPRDACWSAEGARAALSRSFADLVVLQERHGVPVAIENLPDQNKSAFATPGLDLGGLGHALDAGHAALAGSLQAFLRDAGSLRHVHLHDNHGPQDACDRHLPLGRGIVDVPAVVGLARARNVAVVLEMVDEAGVLESLDYLRQEAARRRSR